MASRRLTDLFIVGKPLEFDDGQGEPVSIFIRKLNTGEHDEALRRANAVRAKFNAVRRDPDSEEYQNELVMVQRFGRDELIGYLLDDRRQSRQPVIASEAADEDEWKNEGYLDGLREAKDQGITDEQEQERVTAELARFDDQVQVAMQAELDDLKADLEQQNDAALHEQVFSKIMDVNASLGWIGEFRMAQIFMAVREEDKKTRYFTDREELNLLPEEVLSRLMTAYVELSVDPTEGKGLRQADSSLDSSESAESKATDDSCGPQGAPE